jgi:endonuclease/exonuclease/phosphatase family metal-dependent hydrolase
MAGTSASRGNATASSARQRPAAALVALTVVLTLESFRLVFPHLYGLKERSSLATVLLVFLAVAVSPLLAPLLGRVLGARRAVALFALLLGAWRLVAQFLHPVPLVVAIAGAVVALTTLTLVLTCTLPLGARARGLSVLAGFAFDTALLGAFITWEPAWQDGIAAGVVATGLAAALLACAAAVYRDARALPASPASPAFSGGVALGALVALEFMFLANSAYLAAAVGIGLGWAILIVVGGAVGALVLAGLISTIGRAAAGIGGLLLAAAGLLLPGATGPLALILVPAAQLGAGLVVARALAPGDRGPVRAGLGLALGWFVGLLAILLFQLHYDRPLPVDNRYVTALLGLVTLLVVVGRRPGTGQLPTRRPTLWAAGALLVIGALVGAVVAGLAPEVAAESPDGTFRVVQWNVRQAVGEDGRVDPEVVAAAIERAGIEAEGRAVVVLNEVARGWPLSGQLDLATWMSYRLGMHLVWGPAAGPQFGNLVLSRFPVAGSEVVALTRAGDYQGRSLVDAVFDLGGGRTVSVLATHLQHRNDAEAHRVRLVEIDEILAYWDGAPATMLVGDLNPRQGDAADGYPPRVPGEFEEIAGLLAAGFTTAGNLEACDPPTSNDNCSDYILAGPGLAETSFIVGDNFGDHRMLVADVTGP